MIKLTKELSKLLSPVESQPLVDVGVSVEYPTVGVGFGGTDVGVRVREGVAVGSDNCVIVGAGGGGKDPVGGIVIEGVSELVGHGESWAVAEDSEASDAVHHTVEVMDGVADMVGRNVGVVAPTLVISWIKVEVGVCSISSLGDEVVVSCALITELSPSNMAVTEITGVKDIGIIK